MAVDSVFAVHSMRKGAATYCGDTRCGSITGKVNNTGTDTNLWHGGKKTRIVFGSSIFKMIGDYCVSWLIAPEVLMVMKMKILLVTEYEYDNNYFMFEKMM